MGPDNKTLWILAGCSAAVAVFCILLFIVLLRRKRRPVVDGYAFEDFCAELLVLEGFEKVELTPASGDFGVDILARKEGVTYAFQCKFYEKPVGTRAVQEIYSGRDFYGCMVGVVMTNSTFTKNAEQLAKAHRILLWDGGHIEEMVEKKR